MSSDFVAGERLNITKNVCFTKGQPEFEELVNLPLETLAEMRRASVEQETAIFENLRTSTSIWAKQAAETLRLTKAMEYVKAIPVTHTYNVWISNEYGGHEISNMVYKMTWRIDEKTRWSEDARKSIIYAWELTWSVYFNVPHKSDVGTGKIGGQYQKRFTDKAEMEKYLQGRIAAYANLFKELSPPIPENQQKRFCVNGCLLPGYTVEPHKPTVAELLAYLDEDNFPADGPQEKDGQEKEKPASPFKKYAQKSPATTVKKKSAPTR